MDHMKLLKDLGRVDPPEETVVARAIAMLETEIASAPYEMAPAADRARYLRRPQRRQWTPRSHRLMVVAVAAAIVVVFFVPFPGAHLFRSTKPHKGVSTVAPIGTQLAALKGADTVAGDNFGGSVAISGTTLIVGASSAEAGGRAYVFTKTASHWKQSAELKGSDTASGDLFGEAVAISGRTAVVGAPDAASNAGRVYIFTETSRGWTETARLTGSDTTGSDEFGSSVSISGTTVVVGAPLHSDLSGSAYVFAKTPTGWRQIAELSGATAAQEEFGFSVAISGTNLVVGAPSAPGLSWQSAPGRAYVYTRTARGWRQVDELGGPGLANDYFGGSVAISALHLIVGAAACFIGFSPPCKGAGRAYVFSEAQGRWEETAQLHAGKLPTGAEFGFSVALSGTTAVVSAYTYGNGSAYEFSQTPAGWKETAELSGSGSAGGTAGFGVSVTVSGESAVVGTSRQAKRAGTVYLFRA